MEVKKPCPELFGTGPGQWPHWWVCWTQSSWEHIQNARQVPSKPDMLEWDGGERYFDEISRCIPAQPTDYETFPMPVQWDVLSKQATTLPANAGFSGG